MMAAETRRFTIADLSGQTIPACFAIAFRIQASTLFVTEFRSFDTSRFPIRLQSYKIIGRTNQINQYDSLCKFTTECNLKMTNLLLTLRVDITKD